MVSQVIIWGVSGCCNHSSNNFVISCGKSLVGDAAGIIFLKIIYLIYLIPVIFRVTISIIKVWSTFRICAVILFMVILFWAVVWWRVWLYVKHLSARCWWWWILGRWCVAHGPIIIIIIMLNVICITMCMLCPNGIEVCSLNQKWGQCIQIW